MAFYQLYNNYMNKQLKKQATAQFSKGNEATHDAFQRLNALLLTLSAKVAEDSGFTLTEILVCEHLRLDGPLTPKEVGERVGLSSGAVTRLLDRLEERGLTERCPHPEDRRKVLMHYLEKDDAATERPLQLYKNLEAVLGTFDASERAIITRFIHQATEAVSRASI